MAEASTSSSAADKEQGIALPPAEFIEDVAAYLKGRSAEEAISELNSHFQLYKMVEQQLMHKRARLVGKLPEIQKAQGAVESLIKKQEEGEAVVVDFELADAVYAKARIANVGSVNLWLGANVMLEYPFEEARELLETNLATCEANLEANRKDLDFIKDCLTTTEVSIARIYNYDVSQRRGQK